MSKLVFIADIDLKGSPHVRSDVRQDVIEDYIEVYRADKKVMPPIDLFTPDGKVFLLADGLHRLSAMTALKYKTAIANVVKGTYEEALSFALRANERHGIRRTHADKRKCIEQAVQQWPKHSNNQIAEICAVDKNTVKAVREGMEEQGTVKPEPIRETKDGKKVSASRSTSPKSLVVNSPAESRGGDKDSMGTVIPDYAMQFWVRGPEVKEVLETISTLIKFIRSSQKAEDLMYSEVNFSAAIADLDKVWTNLQTAVPYAVCTQCQGHPQSQPNGECRLCKGKGLISKFRWDTVVPSEIRKMKEKK